MTTTTNDTAKDTQSTGYAVFFEIETYTAEDRLHEVDSFIVMGPTESVPHLTTWRRSRRTRDHRTRWEYSGGISPMNPDADTLARERKNTANRLLSTIGAAARYSPGGEAAGAAFSQKIVHMAVVGLTDAEHKEYRADQKTPYPVLDRVKRVLKTRGDTI